MNYIKAVLEKNFSYFKKLSKVEKDRFALRVQVFKRNKKFEGRKDFVVDERVEILISATAVQLTFGLNDFLLDHFDKILIYPQKYFSTYDQHFHTGEVNTAGLVVLSWEDFYNGILNDHDSKNVGLHEFAHSLMLSDVMNKEVDSFFSNYYEEWAKAAHSYIKRHQHGSGFFRNYALSNIQEFFAVGVEYFFEKTDEFRAQEPGMFVHFCRLLNQVPDRAITHIYESEENNYPPTTPGLWKEVKNTKSVSKIISRLTFIALVLSFLFFTITSDKNRITEKLFWIFGIVYFFGFLFYYIKKDDNDQSLSYFHDRISISKKSGIIKEILHNALSRIEFVESSEDDDGIFHLVFYYKNGEIYKTNAFEKDSIVDKGILNYLYNKAGIFVLHKGTVEVSKLKI